MDFESNHIVKCDYVIISDPEKFLFYCIILLLIFYVPLLSHQAVNISSSSLFIHILKVQLVPEDLIM